MEVKKLRKYFIFLLLLTLIIFNWNEVSWIFNYRAVSGFFSEIFKSDDKGIKIAHPSNDTKEAEEEHEYYDKEDSVEIPKIGIDVPLVFIDSLEIKEIEKGLDLGVVHFADSVLPGQDGQTIILGHSAPPTWPKMKYYWVFIRIDELIEGDEIYLFSNNRKYEYKVSGKFYLDSGEDIPHEHLTDSKNMLYLVSCWPPETGTRRIAVEAQLQ